MFLLPSAINASENFQDNENLYRVWFFIKFSFQTKFALVYNVFRQGLSNIGVPLTLDTMNTEIETVLVNISECLFMLCTSESSRKSPITFGKTPQR